MLNKMKKVFTHTEATSETCDDLVNPKQEAMSSSVCGESQSEKTETVPQEKMKTEADVNLDGNEEKRSAPFFEKILPFLKRQGRYTKAQHAQQYNVHSSFLDFLPWVEFLDEDKAMLLEDGVSVGAFFELTVIGSEGRSLAYMEAVRTQITNALQDSFPEFDANPWVVQFFCQNDEMAMDYEKVLRSYVRPTAKGSAFSKQWLKIMAKHLRDVSKAGGLFEDKAVTGTPWRGQQRRTRMVVYRYCNAHSNLADNVEALNAICESISNALAGGGVKVERLDGSQVHEWLLRWFNPNPTYFDDPEEFYKTAHYTKAQGEDKDLYLMNDFAETLMLNPPRNEGDYWYLDEKPHSVLVVDSIRRAPDVGLITGEMKRGDNINALFDKFPENTIMSMTIVAIPQDVLESEFLTLHKKSVGDNAESVYTKQAVVEVQEYLQQKHKLYSTSFCFYLTADDEKTLQRNTRNLVSSLQASGLVPTQEGCEIAPHNTYLRWLPMCFNPNDDPKRYYTKYQFVQHIANLLPIYGRSIGTRHPGITYFNRGGSPLDFDPLNKDDRAKSGHLLLLGPTGAGKSATLNGKIAQLMAIYRPRLFIIEAGNSFGLLAEYMKRYGLTVNHIQLKPGSGVSLPLFADAVKLVDDYDKLDQAIKQLEDDESSLRNAELAELEAEEAEETQTQGIEGVEASDQRDILGEMEIIARLMITGGKANEDERMTRADEAMIRRAILIGANMAFRENRICLTEDIAKAFHEISLDDALPSKRRERAFDMGEAIGMFCQPGSFDAELFNSVGEPWVDADVTLVDLATLAREGYEVQLSIAYISLINHINSLGEKHQFSGRPIVNITDEAHIITVNPMLARFLAKGGKMWRKLGIWLWLATQNMKDFPNEAAKLLSMLEWWELLYLEKDEVNQIARFKSLTDEQTQLLLSTKKENRKYTEGVVLASKMEALFRVVPPSLFLALAMTEPEEKAERAEMMIKYGISELDSALMVAKAIDKARGIL